MYVWRLGRQEGKLSCNRFADDDDGKHTMQYTQGFKATSDNPRTPNRPCKKQSKRSGKQMFCVCLCVICGGMI